MDPLIIAVVVILGLVGVCLVLCVLEARAAHLERMEDLEAFSAVMVKRSQAQAIVERMKDPALSTEEFTELFRELERVARP